MSETTITTPGLVRSQPAKSYLVYYLVSVLIWGSEAVLTKRFLVDALAPGPMILLRSTVTALCLLPLVLMERPRLDRLDRRDWLNLLALSLVGTALPTLLYFAALIRIPASTTMLLYRTEPIFVIVLSVVVLHQRIAPRIWLLTLAAILFSYLIAVGEFQPPPLSSDTAQGALLVLASTALYAGATILGKALLDKVSPLTLVWLRFSLALPVLAVLFGAETWNTLHRLTAQNFFWLLWMGSISSGLAYVFYYRGLQASNPIVASVMTLLGPVTGLTLSVLLLHEQFSLLQIASIVGLLTTMVFLTRANLTRAASA